MSSVREIRRAGACLASSGVSSGGAVDSVGASSGVVGAISDSRNGTSTRSGDGGGVG